MRYVKKITHELMNYNLANVAPRVYGGPHCECLCETRTYGVWNIYSVICYFKIINNSSIVHNRTESDASLRNPFQE